MYIVHHRSLLLQVRTNHAQLCLALASEMVPRPGGTCLMMLPCYPGIGAGNPVPPALGKALHLPLSISKQMQFNSVTIKIYKCKGKNVGDMNV